MNKMKVAMYYNNNDIRIEEMPIPTITDNELLVNVKACGICGSDVMEWYRLKKAPLVLGHEMTGEIVKVGKNITEFNEGDRVFVSHHVPCNRCTFCQRDQHTLCDTLHSTNFIPGGFAEYLKVPEINVKNGTFKLPKEISYEEGTFIEPLACAIRGFRIAAMKPGQSVLIIGSGIAGLLTIKLACVQNAARVIATDVNPYRLKMAKNMGADTVIDAQDDVKKQVKKQNQGRLADLVILCTGAPAAAQQAFHLVDRGGTILLFAPTDPGVEIPVPLFDLWNKGVTIVTTYAGSPRDIEAAIELLASKKVVVTDMITHRFPLADAAQGFHLVANAQDSVKVIIIP